MAFFLNSFCKFSSATFRVSIATLSLLSSRLSSLLRSKDKLLKVSRSVLVSSMYPRNVSLSARVTSSAWKSPILSETFWPAFSTWRSLPFRRVSSMAGRELLEGVGLVWSCSSKCRTDGKLRTGAAVSEELLVTELISCLGTSGVY